LKRSAVMTKSTTSTKSRPKIEPAADEAPRRPSVVAELLAGGAPLPDEWEVEALRRILKWQIEQIEMEPTMSETTEKRRARDARIMAELARTLDEVDAVKARREKKGKKTETRDERAIKENFVRKLDQLLAARDEGSAAPGPRPG